MNYTLKVTSNVNRKVIIVDSYSLFTRSYIAYPTMSSHGYQMGGCIGYLKTLRRIVEEVQPSAVYVAWEGGGSTRRRAILPEYKLGRRPAKLNRFYEDDIPDTDDNKKHQLFSLLSMIKCLPICQLYVSDCEADDLIAYLCSGPLKSPEKIIVTSDKDLYQLLDEKTQIYSLYKKTYVCVSDVIEEYRVTPENFAIAKALCGDASDNIPGIKGIGFKTVSKLFPFLGTDSTIVLQDVFNYCHTHINESTFYKRVIENEDLVKKNYRLVFLNGNMVPLTQASKIDSYINSFKPKTNRTELIKALIKDGVNDFDVDGLIHTFNCVEGMTHQSE